MKFQFVVSLLVGMLFSFQLQAQLCTGSLGDPVVNIDFGSGVGRGGALASGTTAYTYIASGRLDEGQYTIYNATTGLRDNAWHATSDHTGNTNGYMMIVNASKLATEGIFYTKTVTDLCPGTTYEFSAWLMNVMIGTYVNPNVTFRVSTTGGTTLGTYNTGELPGTSSAVWKQFGFYFTTGTETQVVITILNNALGAIPGNDLALDDITFRACGPTVTSTIVNESTTSLEICENEAKELTISGAVSSASYVTAGYQWQETTDNGVTWTDISGANAASYTFTANTVGTYKYRLATADSSNISSSNCRVFSNEITIKVDSNPLTPTLQTTQPTCDIPTGTIAIAATAGTTYSIDDVNFQTSGVFSGLAGGDYNVTAKTGICVSTTLIAHINSIATSNATPTVTIVQPVICTNPYGTITVTSPDAEYSFDNGVSWQSSPVKSGLDIGDYLVKTRNSSLCETTAITVTIEVPPGYPPTPTVVVVQPDCFTATGTITVTDAAAAYSFDNGGTWVSSNTKNNLIAGTYKVLIKNALGCNSLVANEVVISSFVNNEPLPSVINPIAYCIQENKTLNDIAIAGTNIKWYDALTSGNLLAGSTVLTSRTYYSSQTVSLCESNRIPVIVTIQNTPSPTGPGLQDFCTTQKATINYLVVTGANIVWYDAATNGNVFPTDTALVNGVTYYATQAVNGCESVNRFAVTISIVSPSIPVNNVTEFICDDDNDRAEVVDLTSFNSKITTCSSCVFTYFNSFSGADNEIESDQIIQTTNYNLPLGKTVVYVRIISNDKCYQVVELSLTLVSVPVIPIADKVSLCQNKSVSVDAGMGFDTYLWSTGETSESIIISEVGVYSVTVTKQHGNTTCSSTKDFTVFSSNIATISTITTQDWTDADNVIVVELTDTSIGNYEYSIDGINYQVSNTFADLRSGDYTVYVKDKNDCGIVDQQVFILNYPKYFTPNADGYNDTWAVKFSSSEPKINTKIFDRYGKFIIELNSTSSWDGTYNGHELPSTDYWFVVTRDNGKVYKGHFTMKR